jgi:hypothetical protein
MARTATPGAPNEATEHGAPYAPSDEGASMQDLLWLSILFGQVLLTLAYARLCDRA